MGWNYLSIPKHHRCSRSSLGMDNLFHPTLFGTCDYLSMLGLKLIHVSKKGHEYLTKDAGVPVEKNSRVWSPGDMLFLCLRLRCLCPYSQSLFKRTRLNSPPRLLLCEVKILAIFHITMVMLYAISCWVGLLWLGLGSLLLMKWLKSYYGMDK